MQGQAFTVVSAKQSFTRPFVSTYKPVPEPHPPERSEKMAREWPSAVRSYVQRSFAESNTIAGISRPEMEAKLKKIISEAAEANTLLTVDWNKLALPQQMLQAEKSAGAQVSTLSFQDTNTISYQSPISRKRKSFDLEPDKLLEAPLPPWRNGNGAASLADRVSHVNKRFRPQLPNGASKSAITSEARKQRFNPDGRVPPSPYVTTQLSPTNAPEGPVVGRCLDLEKRYFRLTAAPNPDTVRPLHILEKTLEFLKQKWRRDSNYAYICDQFKSLRQDLTVQHIKTAFTVNVYEIHARIALEKGDLGEYNQCQTQLRALYAQNLGGHSNEFKAYRILYFLHTGNRTDMNDVLADLTTAEKNAPAIRHALDARSSLALGNYHRFFKLYLETPNMGAYLMDMFVTRERLAALANICRAYKPDVKLRFITEELGFESDKESAYFICDHRAKDQEFLEGEDDDAKLLTGKAAGHFEAARKAAFQKVDIKGQI